MFFYKKIYIKSYRHMKNIKYSVLMSVYYAESASYFENSIDSILNQTVCTDDFVIVCDGPLTDALNNVINKKVKQNPSLFNIVRLPINSGLGTALNIGLKHCRNELIARMDSDDLSLPDRCEKQLKIFDNYSNVDIVSGIVREFDGESSNVIGERIVPEFNDEILKYAKFRCPFNHPCVMYKKTSVEQSGGYQDFYKLEDYYLWIRMLVHGFVGYNIQKPLLLMRGGNGLYKRRGGLQYAVSQFRLVKYMHYIGFIGYIEFVVAVLLRSGAAICPAVIRKTLYKILFR